jgi:hypothetical protein
VASKTRSASAPRRRPKRRPTVARRSKKARLAESVREVIATIAVQRRLKQSIAKLEETDPQSSLLAEYRALNTQVLLGLRLLRVQMKLIRLRGRTKTERELAAEHLHLIDLTEVEFGAGVETAH